MPSLFSQLLKVGGVGLALGLVVGTARGFPAWVTEDAQGAASCASPVPESPQIGWISPEQAHQLWSQSTATFFDARRSEAFAMGHVSGALHAPMTTGTVDPAVIERAPTGGAIIVYDDAEHDCAKSVRLARLLAATGRPEVRVLEGGFPAWVREGHPAESGHGEPSF